MNTTLHGVAGRSGTAIAAAVLVLLLGAFAPQSRAEGIALDHWPTERADDMVALQRGARIFVNYCLNCHSARQMRWNRLREIGIDDAQIKSQLIFGDQKVGDVMTVAMNPHDAKNWFGKAPPDLSVMVRARSTEEHRGTDYIYTLLRGFYRDSSTLTGWNNVVYPNIAMPNILWQRQGARKLQLSRTEWEEHPAEEGKSAKRELVRVTSTYETDGSVSVERTVLDKGETGVTAVFTPVDPKAAAAVDDEVADLVAYLNWMAEPTAHARYKIGVWVMGFLAIFLLVAHWLNKVFWRDIK